MQNIIFIYDYVIITPLDFYVCLTQLKQALKIEENICGKNNNEDKFFKFHVIYEKL